MPYIGKPQSADPITVNTSNIDDGTIQAVDISSSFREHISGSFQGGGSNKISGSLTSTGSFGKVEVGSGKITTTGNMVLDADGAQIRLEDGGTEFGRISRVSSDLVIKSISNNNDILFKGVDGSSTITALQLDMSEAGNAIFNNDVTIAGTLTAQEIHTEFTSASILFTSGSTIFGNSSDDVHNMTGSLNVSGSLFVKDGTLTVTDNVDFNGDLDVDGTTNLDDVDIDGDLDVDGTTNLDNTDIDGTLTVAGGVARFSRADTTPAGTDPHGIFDDGVFGSTDTTNTGITIFGSGQTSLAFGDAGDSDIGQVRYQHSTNKLEFMAAAGIRMVVSGSGFVGIGSNTPTAHLDVAGGAVIGGDTIVGRTGNQKGKLTIQSRTGTATRKTNAIVAVPYNDTSESICMIGMDGQSSNNEMHIGSNTSDFMSPTYIDFFTASDVNSQTNSRAMRITSDQKIGIGTDSPSNNLHIHTDNSAEGILLKSTGDTRNNLIFDGNISSAADNIAFIDANWNGTNVARISMFTGTDTSNKDDGRIGFATAAAGTVAERMRIESDGRVAIKATSFPQDFGGERGHLLISSTDNAGANNYGVLLLQGHSIANDVATGGIYFYDHNNNTATIQALRDNSTSTGYMIFYTNGGSGVTERMRITSGGEVRVKSGDIVFDTAGKGIVLGNTSNADGNTLDDYEEGSWTPVPYYQNASDQTVAENNDSNALGRYIVVGRQVTLWAAVRVDMSSTSITFDNFGIKGLPFSTANITNYRAVGCFAYSNSNVADEDTAFTISMGPNNNHMHIQQQDGTGNMAQNFGNSSNMELFGTISFLLP